MDILKWVLIILLGFILSPILILFVSFFIVMLAKVALTVAIGASLMLTCVLIYREVLKCPK